MYTDDAESLGDSPAELREPCADESYESFEDSPADLCESFPLLPTFDGEA